MSRVECWATIEDEQERKSVMAWVRAGNFESYAEVGTRVSVTYKSDPEDPDDSSRKWGVIHFFEHYPEHGIYGHGK